jgi:endonuclease YncB( thermonuclease family)
VTLLWLEPVEWLTGRVTLTTLRGPMTTRSLAIALLGLLPPSPAFTQGSPEVTDGDTFRLNGIVWRLHGVDAPERRQVCADGWHAGEAARRALERIVSTDGVTCEKVRTDEYGRTVGTCRADGEDIGAVLVRQGMAWVRWHYSWRHLPEEWPAWWNGVGIHARDYTRPWRWRAEHR